MQKLKQSIVQQVPVVSVYNAVIERSDGSTYIQRYKEFEDLIYLIKSLGRDYFVVDIF